MKATGIFVILLSQVGFETDCPETKFQTITSSSQFRSSRTQMFFKKRYFAKISQQENTCVGVFFIKVVRLKVCTFMKKRLEQVFSCEYCEMFETRFFCRTPPVAAFVSLIRYNCSVLGICRPSPLNQKHNVGWFLLKGL